MWIKRSDYWYSRGRESITFAGAGWNYYENSIASGILCASLEAAMSYA